MEKRCSMIRPVEYTYRFSMLTYCHRMTKRHYDVKPGLLGLDNCPYKFPADHWINDPKQWPKIEYSDVYYYLIKLPSELNSLFSSI